MSRRYHTTGCGTPHIIAPGYKHVSNPRARFEPTPDIRKGSIRGFCAMCLVFGLLCVVGVMF